MAWSWNLDRKPGYLKIAEKTGLQYQEKDENKLLYTAHKIFQLFKMGGSKKARHILSGMMDSREFFSIFEYSYVVSTGKSTATIEQHVLSVRLNKDLPAFDLKPENIIHKIGDWLGFNDIDFEAFPQFSKLYRLKSKNEAQIRKLFNESVLGFLSFDKGWSIECDGQTIIYYKSGKRMKEVMIEPFIEASTLLHLILTGFKKIDNTHL